jgi:hypothetical protein
MNKIQEAVYLMTNDERVKIIDEFGILESGNTLDDNSAIFTHTDIVRRHYRVTDLIPSRDAVSRQIAFECYRYFAEAYLSVPNSAEEAEEFIARGLNYYRTESLR